MAIHIGMNQKVVGKEPHMANEILEQDDTKIVYQTSFGIITVFLKDEPGAKGGKAGTTKTVPHEGEPVARRIKLKKKYRQQS